VVGVSAKNAPAHSANYRMKGTAFGFETKRIASAPDVFAPDGSEVRVLCQLSRGGLAVFSLPPNAVSKAVAHRTVEEVWYIISGKGCIWRKLGDQEEIVELDPGVSLTIPTGTRFQFRCDGLEPLNIIGATMPPWPGEEEAFHVEGKWEPTI
jgi:mannose-6-phosphate isomerase-like protein (cupin superfamily)